MPIISVDGEEYEVDEGRTILQALDDLGLLMNGIDIPHYCWHPKLSIDGSCRLCQVEIEGFPKLQIACNTPVKDGMEIRTQNERVKRAREGVMELLLVNHPLDCTICDQAGECKLQDYAFEYGVSHARTREPRRALKKKVDLGPTIVFDQERCILCRRCTRFTREIPETSELTVVNRGDRSVIETFPGTQLDNDYSMNVADICPVGALTTKDFRFKIRVWFLEDVEGICTGCANGCNVHIGTANNKVQRYTPRRNDAVNETWICDEGRLSYKEIGAPDRVRQPLVREGDGTLQPASHERALSDAARLLKKHVDGKGPGVVAGLASGHVTNEDLAVFRRLLDGLGIESRALVTRQGPSDQLLIKAEKAANGEGARHLGFDGNARALVERLIGGAFDALVVMGHDLLDPSWLEDASVLAELDTLIALDAYPSELHRHAHVVFPARHTAEKLGTLTNHAGRVQRVTPAVEPPFEAYSEGEVLWRLGVAMGVPGFEGGFDVHAISKSIGDLDAAFRDLHVDSVGSLGSPLGGTSG